ncbi:MAG: SDR family oxidoreductase [Planctomycetota bacterium]|jgi:NAD(P)-dependent dehydrogenase (short-subunit alcohol dehydrogenase family)
MTNTNRGRFQLGIVAALLTLAAGLHGGPPDGAPATPPALRVLITGANRGLGLEFARQFHAAGARVVGTARRPDAADQLKALGVRVEQLDVTDAESVARLASRIGSEPVDIVINNAGIGGRHPSIEQIDADAVDRIFQVNCLGPMRVTQALLPALRKGDRKLVVNISSRLGSIELNGQGNMFSRSLASELSAEGFTCVVISPGWVRTDMGGSRATLSPAESIQGMIAVINGLTTRDSGGFFDYRGERLPW